MMLLEEGGKSGEDELKMWAEEAMEEGRVEGGARCARKGCSDSICRFGAGQKSSQRR